MDWWKERKVKLEDVRFGAEGPGMRAPCVGTLWPVRSDALEPQHFIKAVNTGGDWWVCVTCVSWTGGGVEMVGECVSD